MQTDVVCSSCGSSLNHLTTTKYPDNPMNDQMVATFNCWTSITYLIGVPPKDPKISRSRRCLEEENNKLRLQCQQ